MAQSSGHDVIVVGAGNAALCAALSARERGASVLVLEKAPRGEHGGNSHFTMAAMRFAYGGLDELREVVPELTAAEIEHADFGSYPEARFRDDLLRVSEGRADPALVEVLVRRSRETLRWLHALGVRFVPLYADQAFEVDGRRRFYGGLTLQARGGGPGLVSAELSAALGAGVEIRYGSAAVRLLQASRPASGPAVAGLVVADDAGERALGARAVVLACGGFEANADWRVRHLGSEWGQAKVRGTRYNTGDGIGMALDFGAHPHGHWSGCHAVAWDRAAPDFGDLAIRHLYQKHSYPLGIMVNARGRRFVDEGADFRNYTYAKYGHAILEQPGHFAYQVFDRQVTPLLRGEYQTPGASRVVAGTLEELAAGLDGVDSAGFLKTVREFNQAIVRSTPFDPSIKDGRATRGLLIDKSNWANPLEEPPFQAYAVTCGITFTFGGLQIDEEARVLDREGRPIPGLFAAGELVGGLFYHNYPGGAGLTAGAVFGRIAGAGAAAEPLAVHG